MLMVVIGIVAKRWAQAPTVREGIGQQHVNGLQTGPGPYETGLRTIVMDDIG